MKRSLQPLLFLSLLFGTLASIHGQNLYQRDSIYLDDGVPGTTDFEPRTRNYFLAYDSQGRPLKILTQRRTPSNDWVNTRQRTFTYENDQLAELLIERWLPQQEIWQVSAQRLFTYDSDGNRLTKQINRAPEPGLPLEPHRLWSYTYNAEGDQLNCIYQEWDSGAFTDISQQTWTYNGDGRLTEQLLELNNAGQWILSRRRGWQYTNSGLVEQVVSQEWSTDTQEWVNSMRQQYLNDGPNVWTGIQKQVWDAQASAWVNEQQELFSYSNNTVLENRTLQLWEDDAWQPELRVSYDFDGTTVTATGDQWDSDQNDWSMLARYQTTYDEESRPLLETGWQIWDAAQSIWFNEDITIRRRHFWSEQSVATEEISSPDRCFFPNPFSKNNSFTCGQFPLPGEAELTLTSLTGQVILRQNLSGEGQFRLPDHVADGMYVVLIRQKNQLVHLQKLVVID